MITTLVLRNSDVEMVIDSWPEEFAGFDGFTTVDVGALALLVLAPLLTVLTALAPAGLVELLIDEATARQG
jgi:hypothetical protein